LLILSFLFIFLLLLATQNGFKFVQQEPQLEIILCGSTPQEKETWIRSIIAAKEVLNNAITASEVESDKVYVDEGVRWNRPEIPMEILMALKEEQALKREKSQILCLDPALEKPKKSRSSTMAIRSPRESGGSRIQATESLSDSNSDHAEVRERPRLKRPSSFYTIGRSTLTVVNKLTRADNDPSASAPTTPEHGTEGQGPGAEFLGKMFIRGI
jgi:hypothetical protein